MQNQEAKNNYHYYSDLSYERLYLNECAKYLRTQADKDYIACRALFRRGLVVHSANLGHQSIEKYLKTNLLFLQVKTRKYGHDLERLLSKAVNSGTSLREQSLKAIELLSGLHNVTRYSSSGSYNIDYTFIYYLDYFVRDIRPYLQNRYVDERWPKHPNVKNIKSGHEYRNFKILNSGHLEKIIKSKGEKFARQREDLVWNNPYFSQRKRKTYTLDRSSYAVNFPFNLDNKSHRDLAKYVMQYYQFEREIEDFLDQETP